MKSNETKLFSYEFDMMKKRCVKVMKVEKVEFFEKFNKVKSMIGKKRNNFRKKMFPE